MPAVVPMVWQCAWIHRDMFGLRIFGIGDDTMKLSQYFFVELDNVG